jgi:hypothetical protein
MKIPQNYLRLIQLESGLDIQKSVLLEADAFYDDRLFSCSSSFP